jgi:hypothetical protein
MRNVGSWTLAVLVLMLSSAQRADAQRLGPEGHLTAVGPRPHVAPIAIAGGDRGYLAVFVRATDTAWELVSHPLDEMARPDPGPGRVLRALDGEPERIVMAATPTQFGVIILEGAVATFVRLARDGEIQGDDVDLGSSRRDAAIAWNGTHFLAVTRDTTSAIRVQRLDEIGQRVDAAGLSLGSADDVAVSSDGDGFLLVRSSAAGLRATRLGPDLAVLGIDGFVVRDRPIDQFDVGFDGSQYIVAWSEGESTFEPRATRISPTGDVLDVGGVSLAPAGPSIEIALAARANQSLIAWATRPLSGLRYTRLAALSAGGTTRGALDVATADVTLPSGEELSGLAVCGDTYAAVVFAQNLEGFEQMRFRVRAVVDDRLGASCAAPSDCSSGHCVDGICCDSACDGGCGSCHSGACEPSAIGTECRASASACDTAESCDGASLTCPPDIAGACEDGGLADGGVVGSPPGGCAIASRGRSVSSWYLVATLCSWVALRWRRRIRSRG